MALRIVRLGTPRRRGEGLRIGTVRRPPRGVPKSQYAKQNWYDTWLPELAPSEPLVKLAQRGDAASWRTFGRRFTAELKRPAAARLLDLLAQLSHHSSCSVGCYCEDEQRCHRSIPAARIEGERCPHPSVGAGSSRTIQALRRDRLQ